MLLDFETVALRMRDFKRERVSPDIDARSVRPLFLLTPLLSFTPPFEKEFLHPHGVHTECLQEPWRARKPRPTPARLGTPLWGVHI